MEIIALHCHEALMFWMCRIAHRNMSARSRNGSQLSSQTVRVDMDIDTGIR